MSFGTLNRHLQKRRWRRKSMGASSSGQLVPVELATKKSPAEHGSTAPLVVVLSAVRRIEVHPDFDTSTFERLVSALERV